MRNAAEGFSLIELLVVMGIIGLLVALAAPVLVRSRQAARAMQCQSNLRTIFQGWQIAIDQHHGEIPYTRQTNKHPNWVNYLNDVLTGTSTSLDQNTNDFDICPNVQLKYGNVQYAQTSPWGYAVNIIWTNPDPSQFETLNEGKKWSAIVQPSRYPWFMDPEIYSTDTGHNAAGYAPNTHSDFHHLGIGPNHSGTYANVAFADGSVRSIPITIIDHDGIAWFENR